MADEELMTLVARTDADAFEVVYDRHGGVAYSLAHRILGARAAAEDACQEAFVSVWRSAGRYDARLGSVRSWILAVTHRRAIDQLRRITRHTDRQAGDETAAERLPSEEDTAGAALRRVDAEATRTLLSALSEDQRRVVELSFYSGFSHGEIAEALDVPLGTVKGRMRLALERLRLAMAAQPA